MTWLCWTRLYWYSELRRDVLKYTGLLQRYYIEYLCVDEGEFKTAIASIHFEAYEQKILGSFFDIIGKIRGQLAVPKGKLDGFRLDVRRFLATMSVISAKQPLAQNKPLAEQLSLMHFHSHVVDNLEQLVVQQCNISDVFFYKNHYIEWFETTLKSEEQNKFLLGFADACYTFPTGANAAVPVEQLHIGKESVNVAHHVLMRTAQKAVGLVNEVAVAMSALDSKVPSACVALHLVAIIISMFL